MPDPAVEVRVDQPRTLQDRRSRRAARRSREARSRRRSAGPPPPAAAARRSGSPRIPASISSRDRLHAGLMDEDLDARLELVVAASVHVVDAEDRLGIGEQVLLRQEVADFSAEHRSAAHAAADIDREAELARVVPLHLVADVMKLDCRTIHRRAGHRDLELSAAGTGIPGGARTTGGGFRHRDGDRQPRPPPRRQNGRR